MKNIAAYIVSAMLGGVVAEINNDQLVTVKTMFIRGATSVVIGIVFGLLGEELFGVKVAIALSALAGVSGFSSLTWISTILKKRFTDKNT